MKKEGQREADSRKEILKFKEEEEQEVNNETKKQKPFRSTRLKNIFKFQTTTISFKFKLILSTTIIS